MNRRRPAGRVARAVLDAGRRAANAIPADFALAPPGPQEMTMTDRTPAETLTAAAERLRAVIADLDGLIGTGTWEVHPVVPGSDFHVVMAHDARGDAEQVTGDAWKSTAAYIAAMHPGVGAALAEWLDLEAALVASLPEAELRERTNRALAVALEILGEAS